MDALFVNSGALELSALDRAYITARFKYGGAAARRVRHALGAPRGD